MWACPVEHNYYNFPVMVIPVAAAVVVAAVVAAVVVVRMKMKDIHWEEGKVAAPTKWAILSKYL